MSKKHGFFDGDRVQVQVTDNDDGVFVTVDFHVINADGEMSTLAYRLWAQDANGDVEFEIYDYQNDERCDINTFPELTLAAG